MHSYMPASWPSGNAFVVEREAWGLNLGQVKSDTLLPTARHRCIISARHRCGIPSKGTVLPERNDAETGPAK